MFPEAKPRGTLRSRGNKTHCFPWGQSLSAYCFYVKNPPKRVALWDRENSQLFIYEAIFFAQYGNFSKLVFSIF